MIVLLLAASLWVCAGDVAVKYVWCHGTGGTSSGKVRTSCHGTGTAWAQPRVSPTGGQAPSSTVIVATTPCVTLQ